MKQVLETTREVADHSEQVRIIRDRARSFSEGLDERAMEHWLKASPFDFNGLNDEEKLAFLFTFNSTSFSYWGNPKWSIQYKGKTFDRGSWSMIASLKRAIDQSRLILDPNYLANLDRAQLAEILRGNTEIPLLDQRLSILKDVGRVIRDKYGNYSNVVSSANGDALNLVRRIVSEIPSFNDSSVYNGRPVYFFKRAQLLASDIGNLVNGRLNNLDELTACADYKLPLVLRREGILEYSPELSAKVDEGIEIPEGSKEEVEIRANTIQAVELIKRNVQETNPRINSMNINDYLWLEAGNIPRTENYHKTRTTNY
jgi:hypothetical protein